MTSASRRFDGGERHVHTRGVGSLKARVWVVFFCSLAGGAAFCSLNRDTSIADRLASEAVATAQARSDAAYNGWVRHENVAEQDLPVIDSECSGYGLDATAHPPTAAELEAAYERVAPFLERCFQGKWSPPFEIAANIHGATGGIAGAAFAALKHADISGTLVDECLRTAFARVCVHPFETPPGHPYIAWLFDERPAYEEPREPVVSVPREERPEIFATGARENPCGTPAFGPEELRRREEARQENARRQDEYFKTWTPAHVPKGCRDLPPPSATHEVRYLGLGELGDPANAMLARCMRKHDVRKELLIALEMDLESGCVLRAKARVEPRGNRALDRCIAQAFAGRVYSAPSDGARQIWLTFAPFEEQADVLSAAQKLVAVPSRCPSTYEAFGSYLPRSKRINLKNALRGADPGIRRCIKQHALQSMEVAINFHAPSGRAVGAAAVTRPRVAKLDTCIARALATTCLPPSLPESPGAPYFSVRYPVDVWPQEIRR